jgi:hypothetical protein
MVVIMSNESVQLHLAEDAAQLIANTLPKLDKPQNDVVQKAPTVVRPRLEYIEFFAKYGQSPYNAAKLYSFLVFHCQRNAPGPNTARLNTIREGGSWGERAYWWVMTRKDIAAACRMTEDEFRGAMAVLERAEVAIHKRGRYYGQIQKYYGKTIEHFRLGVCQRGNGLDCWPTVEQMAQMRIVLGGGKSPLSAGGKAPALVQSDAVVEGDAVVEKSYESPAELCSSGNDMPSLITEEKQPPKILKGDQTKPTPNNPPSSARPPLAAKCKQQATLSTMKKANYSKNTNPVLPAGDSPTSVCPNSDRLKAEGHDLQHLLSLCQTSQFAGAGYRTHTGRSTACQERRPQARPSASADRRTTGRSTGAAIGRCDDLRAGTGTEGGPP